MTDNLLRKTLQKRLCLHSMMKDWRKKDGNLRGQVSEAVGAKNVRKAQKTQEISGFSGI